VGEAAAQRASSPEEAEAQAVWAEALLAGGRLDEAAGAAASAWRIAERSQVADLRVHATLARARVAAAAGRPSEAVRGLQGLEEFARASGWLRLTLEARLAWAEVDLAQPQRREGARTRLDALARTAGEKGLGRLRRRALAALASAADTRSGQATSTPGAATGAEAPLSARPADRP
jgi:hypothetical protein